jgi:GxxExxY protein
MKRDSILYKDLSYKLVGCFYEVYNILGPGQKESIYHNALAIELRSQYINFKEKEKISIDYKGNKVGIYEPDFVIDNKILVEIKSVPQMPRVYEKQLKFYLKGTKYKLGYLVNFGSDEIDIRRRIMERKK